MSNLSVFQNIHVHDKLNLIKTSFKMASEAHNEVWAL